MARPKAKEALRAALGAGLALAVLGLLLLHMEQALGGAGLFLIAPLGATGFLLFAVPNSPLAQPFSAVVGNGVSGLVAVSVLQLGLSAEIAVGLAVSGAVAAMAALRAMHPPGGAVSVATVLSASLVEDLGYGFVLSPVLLDTVLLVLLAVLYNRLTGRRYPFRQAEADRRHGIKDIASERRLGLSADRLEEILRRFRQSSNIGAEDFGRILAAAEREAARRQFGTLTCADIMTKGVISVRPDMRLDRLAVLFRRHDLDALPVTSRDGRLVGLLSRRDLVQHEESGGSRPGLADRVARIANGAGGNRVVARDIMAREVEVAAPEARLVTLLPLLAERGIRAAPVVEGGVLVGIVTRADLLAALAHQIRHAPGAADSRRE